MNQVGVLALTALLVLAAVGAGTGAVVATSSDNASQESDIAGVPGGLAQAAETTNGTNTTTENETTMTTDDGDTEWNDSETTIDAGAKLAGVIGSQQAEHESAVQTRAFDRAFERAATNGSQAAIVATSSEQIEERIQELENESDRLQQRYENGSISKSAYYARTTVLTARITALETRANQTSMRAKALPKSALEARGMNTSDVRHLETRVRNVTSPHASAIAKRVAGPQVGQPMGPPETVPGHEGDRGPPGTSNQSAKGGNTSQNGPPDHSENRIRSPGNNTATNASVGQEPGSSHANDPAVGQGPGDNRANNPSVSQGPGNKAVNNASMGGNGIDARNGQADKPSESDNVVIPVNNGQNSAPFNDSDVPPHANT